MQLVYNRSFTLTTGTRKQSMLQRLKNGVPKELVLAPLLFSINTYDLQVTVVKTRAYSADLVILHCGTDWQALEETLT